MAIDHFESDDVTELVSSAALSTAEETLRHGVNFHLLTSSLHSSITLGVRKNITRFRKPCIVWEDRGQGIRATGDQGYRGAGDGV